MSIQATIKKDLAAAIKARDAHRKDALRVIMGEFARQNKKVLSDDEVVGILRKLLKAEKETLERGGTGETSTYMQTITNYLPQPAEDQEIASWIAENIDFTQYKNRFQAMGAIMQHFGARADGNRVKAVLQTLS